MLPTCAYATVVYVPRKGGRGAGAAPGRPACHPKEVCRSRNRRPLSEPTATANPHHLLLPENMIASPAAEEPPVNVGSAEHQEEAQTVIQGIRDEPAADTALQSPTADPQEQEDAAAAAAAAEADAEEDEGSCYWDASTMAPLNTASAVSTMSLLLLHPWLSNPSSCAPRPPSPA